MKKVLLSTLTMSLLLALTSCSSDSGTTTSTPSTTTPSASTESASTDDTASDDAGSESTSDKVWIIATDTTYIPFEYTNEAGEFVGLDVDLLAAVAEDQGFEYELQILGWDGAVAAVQSGQADGLIAGASKTEERMNSGWLFSEGYYNANQTVILPEGSTVTSWEELAGETLAVKIGTASMDYGLAMAEEYGFSTVSFEDTPTMIQDVLMGNSAGCFEDTPVMAATIKEQGLALMIPEGMHNEGADYGFAIMDESNMELLEMFDAGLVNVTANGTYDEIIEKYFG